MKKMTSNEIREMWYKFFGEKGHFKMASAPLIPINDDSLLWINAGVSPLKKYFDGSVIPDNKRIVNVQKCIRTNDIENVGITSRHLTFFEMMGNFSIGDYFKIDAINFAFELLTSEEYFAIPKDKLYVTVYTDDIDAYNEWIKLGMSEDHVVKLDGNFWEIGEGPCGPDSEIFYDRGVEYDKDNTALQKFKNDEDQDRYIEIWNNVFSQYNSKSNLERKDYPELPHKNIDTGAGLERWACVFQEVDSNFDTDLFVPIINHIEKISDKQYDKSSVFKIIADHIRTVTVALSDGAVFENVGRGYVLRRLLRRSVRVAKKLDINEPFMYKLVDTVVQIMKDSYPEIENESGRIKTLVLQEEELFHKTLFQGEKRLSSLIEGATSNIVDASEVFKLYDTYGFPFELTKEILEENNLTTSIDEFNKFMEQQKEMSKMSRKTEVVMNSQNEGLMNFKGESKFIYDDPKIISSVIGLFIDSEVDQLIDKGFVIFKETCFYATNGGQLNDTGIVYNDNFRGKVISVFKGPNNQNVHVIEIEQGVLKNGDLVTLEIDVNNRLNSMANHSSVHILHHILKEMVSDNIKQAGSYVDCAKARLDFNCSNKLNDDIIIAIEDKMNEFIKNNTLVKKEEMNIEDAKKIGAVALFDEKYSEIVRVITLGDSIELCGGTHINRFEDIKKIAILDLENKGSNVYRLELTTNDNISVFIKEIVAPFEDEIINLFVKAKSLIEKAQNENIDLEFNVYLEENQLASYKDIVTIKNKLEYIQNEVKELEKNYSIVKQRQALSNLDKFSENLKNINNVNTIIMKTYDEDVNILKEIVDVLLNKIGTGLIFIANINGDSVSFVGRSNLENINIGSIVKDASIKSLGNGGGNKNFAQGGGKTTEFVEEIFKDIINNL